MIVNLFYLFPAVALLWIPRQLLRFRRSVSNRQNQHKYTDPRSFREPGDVALRPGEEFFKLRNYTDFLRGMAGSYGVMVFGLSSDASASPETRIIILSVQAFILVAAVFLQTMRWEGRLVLQAPVFFLAGLASGVCGIESAIYGTAAAWVLNAILPSPAAFLLAQGISIGAFGAIYHGLSNRMVFIAVFLTILPSFIGFALRRPLAVGTRRPAEDM
ncbi:MAG: hypothetical protein WC378_15870 [Opitutaceae bacterium]